MKTEDLATEFLLTFLAVLVQLGSWGPPAGPSLNGPSLNGPSLNGPPGAGSVSELGLSPSSNGGVSSSSLATGLAYSAGLTVHRGALNPARALGPAFVANRFDTLPVTLAIMSFSGWDKSPEYPRGVTHPHPQRWGVQIPAHPITHNG